jgi:murein DD-endopeptidase MepM/ murein hydrolase activator NlpD
MGAKILVSDLLTMQVRSLTEMSEYFFRHIAYAGVLLLIPILACTKADSAEGNGPSTAELKGTARSSTIVKPMEIQPVMILPAQVQAKEERPTGPQFARIVIDRTLEGGFVTAVGKEQGPALSQVAKRALVWWINPRTDLRKKDELELVYSQPTEGEPVIHAIWFKSGKLATTKSAVLFKSEKNDFPRWFQPDGSELAVRLVNGPIRYYEQITSLLKDGRGHKGMDFKAPVGSKIYAPFAGKIVRKNWSRRANGLCLDIQRSDGVRIYLLHLDKIVRGLGVGSWVKTGQHIAFSGNTGRSTAPHLHYQIEKTRRGRVLDPLKMHKSTRFRLQADELTRMRHRLSRLDRLRSESIR